MVSLFVVVLIFKFIQKLCFRSTTSIVLVASHFFPEKEEDIIHDGRTLYERLKEQKDRKQEEFEEQLKFSKPTVQSKNLTLYHKDNTKSANHLCFVLDYCTNSIGSYFSFSRHRR